jgi:hypothetical protein
MVFQGVQSTMRNLFTNHTFNYLKEINNEVKRDRSATEASQPPKHKMKLFSQSWLLFS